MAERSHLLQHPVLAGRTREAAVWSRVKYEASKQTLCTAKPSCSLLHKIAEGTHLQPQVVLLAFQL